MSEPAQKCENNERYFYAKVYSKIVYCCLKWYILALLA